MPNGRSGGFIIEAAVLKQLIQAVSADAVVGWVIRNMQPQPARAAEVIRFIEGCPHDDIDVEEQDHAWYIIHFSNGPDHQWVQVSSDSPLLSEFRRRHAQWMAEHPGWRGWISF